MRLAALLLALIAAGASAHADPVRDFYAGRTVQILVGFSAGGGYDLYARTLARYLGRHIPGAPAIVVQNMPGAGSLKAANYLYAVAPRDGSVLATFARGLAVEPLLGHDSGVQFDATRFTWIGSVSNEVGVCAFWHGSGIASWHDMETKPMVIGGSGAGADSEVFPLVLRNLFHMSIKIVLGFPGGADMNLAMERHEIDGRCGWSWSSLIARDKAQLDARQIDVTVQLALEKHEDLPQVPLAIDLAAGAEQRAALRLILSRQSMARPFAGPPGLPAERAAALRTAFDATMRDPDFRAEAAKLELEVRPVDGAAVAALIAELYASPPAVIARARAAVKGTPGD